MASATPPPRASSSTSCTGEAVSSSYAIACRTNPVEWACMVSTAEKYSLAVLVSHKISLLHSMQRSVRRSGGEGMSQCTNVCCRNIRHAMFQPATKSEVACIVHFHLHNPIMVSLAGLRPILPESHIHGLSDDRAMFVCMS